MSYAADRCAMLAREVERAATRQRAAISAWAETNPESGARRSREQLVDDASLTNLLLQQELLAQRLFLSSVCAPWFEVRQ